MDEFLKYAVSGANELRWNYAKYNNELMHGIENIETDFKAQNLGIFPEISPNVKHHLESRKKAVKEAIADRVCFNLIEFKKHYGPSFSVSLKRSKRFSSKVVKMLEKNFKMNKYPSDEQKEKIVKVGNLTIKQVNNWFINKRNRIKIY